jgi:hypothetical protein
VAADAAPSSIAAAAGGAAEVKQYSAEQYSSADTSAAAAVRSNPAVAATKLGKTGGAGDVIVTAVSAAEVPGASAAAQAETPVSRPAVKQGSRHHGVACSSSNTRAARCWRHPSSSSRGHR